MATIDLNLRAGPAMQWRDELATLLQAEGDTPRAAALAERCFIAARNGQLFEARFERAKTDDGARAAGLCGAIVLWPGDVARGAILEARRWRADDAGL